MLPCHWYAVAQAARVQREPASCSLLGEPLVLFRDAAGVVGAVIDRCPHRNAPLSQGHVSGGRLICPYHGWEFDRAGLCQAVPGLCNNAVQAARMVRSFPVVEQDGLIWVYPEQPAVGVPPHIDLLHQSGYTWFVRDFTLQASLLDAVENFLDPTHTHFVHTGLVRRKCERRPVRVIVRRGPDFAEAEYLEEQQSGLIARLFGAGISRSIGRFALPATVQLEYWAGARLKLLITLYFTPQSPTEQHVFAVVAADSYPLPHWLVKRPFEWMLARVVQQDQRILALQAANLCRFGGPQFLSTEIDLLRPHIARLLEGHRAEECTEKHVTLML